MAIPEETAKVQAIWSAAMEKVKLRLVLPSVWRAMEAAKPLLLDGDSLIIGFLASRSHEGGLLMDSKNNNIIERALEEEAGRPVRIRIIEGDSVEDWQAVQRRDEEAVVLQKAAQDRRRRETSAEQGWDGISERLTRRYSEMAMRQLPQIQAAYLEEAVETLAGVVDRLLGEKPSEIDHRGYARVLDKVADRAQVPAALIAWLVNSRKSNP